MASQTRTLLSCEPLTKRRAGSRRCAGSHATAVTHFVCPCTHIEAMRRLEKEIREHIQLVVSKGCAPMNNAPGKRQQHGLSHLQHGSRRCAHGNQGPGEFKYACS